MVRQGVALSWKVQQASRFCRKKVRNKPESEDCSYFLSSRSETGEHKEAAFAVPSITWKLLLELSKPSLGCVLRRDHLIH